MLTEFIQSALEKATYEIIDDDEQFYGEVPELKGVWAQAKTLEDCRKKLKEVIEGWVIIRLQKKLEIPVINKFKIPTKHLLLKKKIYA